MSTEDDDDDDDDDDDTITSSSSSLDAGPTVLPEDASVLANTSRRNSIVSIDYSLTSDGRAFADGPNDGDEDGVYGEKYDDEWVIGSFGQ